MDITDPKETKQSGQQLRQISVSQANCLELKRLGCAGDSFNDVITEVLKKARQQKPIDQGGS